MASLEQVQGQFNSQDVNLGNVSTSNDLLSAGAEELARGQRAGFTAEETLGVLSRRRRHQHPNRLDNREVREARQRYATITDGNGAQMDAEIDRGVRSLANEQVQFNLDHGERDQSEQDAYYGRDENEFTRWNKDRGAFDDVYIPDGKLTPDDLRDQALLRSYGLAKRMKMSNNQSVKEPLLDRRGKAIRNEDGEVIMRSTYDIENINETTSGQGWQGGGGRAANDAYKQLEIAIRLGKISEAEAAPLMERLRRTADPSYAKQVERREGRKAVIMSSMNYDPLKRQEHDEIYAEQIAGARKSSNLAGVEYLPGSLTKWNTDPEGGITISTARAEPDSIFAARPQAVQLSGDAVEIARALGDDVSAYVDLGTGEGVEGVTPARLQTNMPNTAQQINAPVTTAASWVASNLKDGRTGDVLADTNVSQITADFSRRVEAAAPGYRSRPVRTVEDFSDQVARVITARQGAGKNFYEPAFDVSGKPILTKSGRQKQSKVTDPGIPDVLRLLRMSSGEQGELANALYTTSLAGEGSRPVSSFSDGVKVVTGSMFGEKLDVGVAGRDTQRAAFAKAGIRPDAPEYDDDGMLIDYGDAQRPQIGSIRERDEFGGVVREEPPLTRAVMKGRSPDEAVATYKAQRAKNKQPVDEVYAEKIRRENASLRADQARLEEDRAVERIMRQAAGNTDPRIRSEAQFIKESIQPAPRFNFDAVPKPKTGYQQRVESLGIKPAPAKQSPVVGTNSVKPPSGQTEATASDRVSQALKTEIAARVDQQRRDRRNKLLIGGGVGAGVAGIGALLAGLNNQYNGSREEQYQ